ncbi:MAG: M48 family metallopeptidase [Pseudomonadota bacterium]
MNPIACDYFDGRSARPRPVRLSLEPGWLVIDGELGTTRVRLAEVQWPERRRHGPRVTHLAGGGSLHCADAAGWDAWLQVQGQRESWVVKAQQSWRATLAAAAALLLVCAALYVWGLPLAARGTLAFVPPTVDAQVGDAGLQAMRQEKLLADSAVPREQQQRLQAALNGALAKAYPDGTAPRIGLHFHKSRFGPNAFALPGGAVIVTDELVQLLEGKDELLLGVLAHEAGHVRHRHGMRTLVQTTLLSSITALAFGDFSTVLAGAPALLGHLGYSRDFEREADGEAIHVMRASGLSPALMATVFERLAAERRKHGVDLGIALASHPADAERIARFKGSPP